MKSFLAAGDVLINPALLAYAVVDTDTDGAKVRLGFAGQAGAPQCEIHLTGFEARSVLRWLRSNAEFLDAGVPPLRRAQETRAVASTPPPAHADQAGESLRALGFAGAGERCF